MDEQFMRKKAVLPLITSMALPMVLSMLVNALYNIVDSYFVARISENAMTALSLVYPLQNLVNAIAIGFGVGISAVIALYLGAGKQKRADQAATQGMLWALVHGVLLTGVCIAIIPLFLQAFTKDQAVIDLGVRYGRIVFGFSIIINADLAFEKIFQAVGRMKVTMVGLGLGCLANIILDPLLIFGLGPFPKMGIDGAALATGLGQVLTLVIYLLFYYLRPISVKIRLQHLRPSRHLVGRLYAIGIPAVLNLALPSVLISALNAILAAFSQTYVLILGAYYKLQTFLYLPANGIVQGMRPVIGFNYGAKEYGRVKQIFRTVLVMTATIMVVGTVLCLVIPGQLIGLFTENAATVAAGKTALNGGGDDLPCGLIGLLLHLGLDFLDLHGRLVANLRLHVFQQIFLGVLLGQAGDLFQDLHLALFNEVDLVLGGGDRRLLLGQFVLFAFKGVLLFV